MTIKIALMKKMIRKYNYFFNFKIQLSRIEFVRLCFIFIYSHILFVNCKNYSILIVRIF